VLVYKLPGWTSRVASSPLRLTKTGGASAKPDGEGNLLMIPLTRNWAKPMRSALPSASE
jgi:hypothetical protein